MLKLIIFLLMFFNINSLTNTEWCSINKILKNKNIGFSNSIIQENTRNVIYNEYERWAIKQSHVFKQYHTYLCRDINGDELAIYGCIGLKKAVTNYDPNKCGLFTRYANFYLKHELYKGVRKLKPINLIKTEDFILEKMYSETESTYEVDLLNDYNEKWLELRDKLNDFEYRCLYYKYSFNFNKQMTNTRIAELMCCSEESIRKVMTLDIIKKIENR